MAVVQLRSLRSSLNVWSRTSTSRRAVGLAEGSLTARVAGNGPLERARARPGFPQVAAVDPLLSEHGSCLHLPAYACAHDDFELLNALSEDVKSCGALNQHRSGKHLVAYGDALASSMHFRGLVSRLLNSFGVHMVDCWVNLYRGGDDTKTLHFDNYHDRFPIPTLTLGLSLGETRDLAFRHRESGREVRVTQRNGDIFAFDKRFNRHFIHGVPRLRRAEQVGTRLAVIVWATEDDPPMEVKRSKVPANVPKQVSWLGWNAETQISSHSCDSQFEAART
eukprot:TRINITY_DN67121_c0_g1_i1.p1 TRINITY_DN67121_c0_g1~~TRINITY_DN67121_c0_g1_i1.p1  ORF type:complete len:279 (-),score=24.52 TRINITY_DN67121_c0_g1_i1:224-1060(-)